MLKSGFSVIIVAAGRGVRVGAGGVPKQFRTLHGKSVLAHISGRFAKLLEGGEIAQIIIVHHRDDAAHIASLAEHYPNKFTYIEGGETRGASVKAGLALVGFDKVLIHDGVRPLTSYGLIMRVMRALDAHQGAAPALPVTDALWQGGDDGRVEKILPRAGVFCAQTPQGFHTRAIRRAYSVQDEGADDVEIAHAGGIDVAILPGEANNIKITYKEDFETAERLCQKMYLE